MSKKYPLFSFVAGLLLACGVPEDHLLTAVDPEVPVQTPGDNKSQPNIVIILADDLGIGDPGAYNEHSRIPTPHLDRLAAEGMRFDDAHSPSAVCSPTRYGLLTGRYSFRTRMKKGVLWGNSTLLIEPGRDTLATMLREKGYHSACIGKWHLGLGSFDPGNPNATSDFSRPFDAGPHSVGFDESLVLPASLDIPPYVLVEGGEARVLPTAVTLGSNRRWIGGGGFWRRGYMEPGFVHESLLPELTDRAVDYLDRRATEPGQPFFLYFPLTAPHTPWVPTKEYQGTTGAGWYGDFVAQVDGAVGSVLEALDRNGLTENTIVIFTSDNGSHWRAQDVLDYAHDAHLGYRGMKADIHEAGHRVPFLVRWPDVVAVDSETDALIGLNDLYGTLADVVGHELKPGEAPDTESFLRVLQGDGGGREELVLHSFDGMFALRQGSEKYIAGMGSGGFTDPARVVSIPGDPDAQLYDLSADPFESHNLILERRDRASHLKNRLLQLQKVEHQGQ